jgi:signal transduction histidine kinase
MAIHTHSQRSQSGPFKRGSIAPDRELPAVNRTPGNRESFAPVWERANVIRSFIWSQESSDEMALSAQFLSRLRRFFNVDFCFIALRREDGKIAQAGVPEAMLDELPVNFVRRSFEVVADSRIPVSSTRLHPEAGFHSVVVSPLSPSIGQPLGFLMLGHSRERHFTNTELFLLHSLAGEVSWAIRELRSKHRHRKLLSAASLELKNSLNTVMGECSVLRVATASDLSADQDRPLSSIEKNAEQALRTVGSFLDTGVDQQGRLSVLQESINLVAVIEDTLSGSREKAQLAGLVLDTQYARDLPRTYSTDPARFRHVLRDLVNHVTLFAERRPVLFRVRRNFDFIELNAIVSGAANTPPGFEAGFYRHHPGDLATERLETLRENLKLLNGHLHLVKLPAEGLEIGICLPVGRGISESDMSFEETGMEDQIG